MSQPFSIVDAFTDRPFAGNPAAVCVMERPAEERWMRDVAREMNLSETAFLHPEDEGYRLRWFTPTVEVDLCGHATLASAHILWQSGRLRGEARFFTRSGTLKARRDGDLIWLDFPSLETTTSPAPDGLETALGARTVRVGRTRDDYLVELESAAVVRGLTPDLRALATLPVRGLIVTAASDDPAHHFISRFFAPRSGVPEDPVTGSAHCALGPYWGARLGLTELRAFQASARGGTLTIVLRGQRVELGGRAVTVSRGELLVPPPER